LTIAQDLKVGAMCEFAQSARRTPRDGVARIFRQENYL
jgi:hypothetical protein